MEKKIAGKIEEGVQGMIKIIILEDIG